MWKPDVVVPEHRYRARIVWGGLLLSITAYTVWQIWKIFDGLNNPSTRLEITDEMYTYPYVLVCFFDGQGCGYGNTDECTATAFENSVVTFNGSDDPEDDIAIESGYTNCVGFDLTKHDVAASGVDRNDAYARISTWWQTTDEASSETEYIDTVGVFITDKEPEDEDMLPFLYVPYTRFLLSDDQLDFSYADLSIGMTAKKDLSGDVITSYPALTISTSTYTSLNSLDSDSTSSFTDVAFGNLVLTIRQGSFSRTYITEVSPLDIGTFLGNIGGFWELLILFWGLVFIATREDRGPQFKARNFAKSIRTGKEIITKRRSLSVDSSASASRAEERPHWESAYRGSHATAAAAGPSLGGGATSRGIASAIFPAAQSANGSSYHQQAVDMSSSSQGRPVVQDVPRRRSISSNAPSASDASALPSYEAMTAA